MKVLLFLLTSSIAFSVNAQMTSGITGKPDTSFANYSAYVKELKRHPEIKLVQEFSFATVQEQKNVVYCTTGQRSLLLDAFYPKKKAKKKSTAILIIHGGGWRSGNRAQHHPLAQQLANLGYVCFTPEYRLSTEALYPAAVYDLKAALRWVRANAKKYNVDTARVVVMGFSAGGELAAFLGVTGNKTAYEGDSCNKTYKTNVNAVVDLDGTLSFVHPESGEGNDTKSISAGTYWFGYSRKDNPALWEEASPLTHAGSNTPPFLFINSGVDRMHAGRDDFRKILDQYNIYSEVQGFPDSPHTFPLLQPWFDPMVSYIDTFLKKVFK
ncbi:MAG: alpha/beta hydrolase [Chitinophagaceae bacterium]